MQRKGHLVRNCSSPVLPAFTFLYHPLFSNLFFYVKVLICKDKTGVIPGLLFTKNRLKDRNKSLRASQVAPRILNVCNGAPWWPSRLVLCKVNGTKLSEISWLEIEELPYKGNKGSPALWAFGALTWILVDFLKA